MPMPIPVQICACLYATQQKGPFFQRSTFFATLVSITIYRHFQISSRQSRAAVKTRMQKKVRVAKSFATMQSVRVDDLALWRKM